MSRRDALQAREKPDGGRREIPWEKAAEIELDASVRRTVGESWLARMKQEHLAVGAFSLIAHELAECGCESVVLGMITRASADEVRHAEVCRRLAVGLLGADAVPERVRGVPKVPQHRGATARERTLLHVIEMCCLNETMTGVFLTEMLERATHVTARAAIESLLEDEIDHGRVGWAYLASVCREKWGASVAREALPGLLRKTVEPVLQSARTKNERDDRRAEAHGYLSLTSAAAVYRDTLREVILPGFAACGVDITAAQSLAQDRGWV